MSRRNAPPASITGVVASLILAGPAFAGEVTGKYLGNGKPAKLVHAVVVPHEPWNDEPAYTLVLSEKAPSGSWAPTPRPCSGSWATRSRSPSPRAARSSAPRSPTRPLKKAGFSTVGAIQSEGVKIDAGTLSGRFYTTKEQDFFGDKWELDLKAKAALPAGK